TDVTRQCRLDGAGVAVDGQGVLLALGSRGQVQGHARDQALDRVAAGYALEAVYPYQRILGGRLLVQAAALGAGQREQAAVVVRGTDGQRAGTAGIGGTE